MGSRGGPDFHSEDEPQTTVYIGNLPSDSIQGDVEHIFSSCKIRSIRMVRDRETDTFRGFAYVEFEDTASVKTALELNGALYDGKELKIDIAQNRNRNGGFRGGRGGAGGGGAGPHQHGNMRGGGFSGGGSGYHYGGGAIEFTRGGRGGRGGVGRGGGVRGGGGPPLYHQNFQPPYQQQHQQEFYHQPGSNNGRGGGGGGGRGGASAFHGGGGAGGGRRQRQGSSGGGSKSESSPPPPPAAGRPKLKLLPRTVAEPVNAELPRNSSIFGSGRPRPPTPPGAADQADGGSDRAAETATESAE